MLELPKEEKSYWREDYPVSVYPELKEDLEVDVAVVGGGITGLTSAYLLKQAGLTVAVIEKDTLGGGTTGRTTGKVTSQHNIIYNDLYTRLGEKTARIYGEAAQAAVGQVSTIVRREKIKCEWRDDDNYVYTADPGRIKSFRDEAGVAARLGLPATFETDVPLPLEILGAVKFVGQAKMNAQKYVLGLARAVDGNGNYVFENSKVTGMRDGSPGRVKTAKAAVRAKHIIVATNVPTLPLMARGGYCLLEYPTESYIVAGPIKKNLKGMYISPDNNHYSMLPLGNNGQQILLVGGEDHISGMRTSKKAKFRKLADYAEKHFGMDSITHSWSDRDYLTYDGPPLIGRLYPWSKHLYVASAFRKWGLTNGTVAAMILSDLITGRENAWAEIFDSTRKSPIASIPRVAAKYILRQN